MPDDFRYDVFLSHSAKDKAVVRPLAERLRQDGLKVWFDEWELKPGDSIPAQIDEGLENSRVLVLCMSAQAFGSDWAQLEAGTFRFRDPLNNERRLIPLRLDDAPIKGSLAQFVYINWRPADCEQEYAKLLEACRRHDNWPSTEATLNPDEIREDRVLTGHEGSVRSIVFSPNGTQALSGSEDRTLRIWDLKSGRCIAVLEGHTDIVRSVAWSGDGRRLLSASAFHRRRVGDALAVEARPEESRRGTRNLAVGFCGAGGLSPGPSALHG
jgi:hypothetical protein